MSTRTKQLEHAINSFFGQCQCQIQDDSAAHAGHAGAASGASHFTLTLISDKFEGLNRVSRHRLVYDAVGEMMHTDIHALVIHALAPSEIQI
jgi:BolA protein